MEKKTKMMACHQGWNKDFILRAKDILNSLYMSKIMLLYLIYYTYPKKKFLIYDLIPNPRYISHLRTKKII